MRANKGCLPDIFFFWLPLLLAACPYRILLPLGRSKKPCIINPVELGAKSSLFYRPGTCWAALSKMNDIASGYSGPLFYRCSIAVFCGFENQ
jgi:hypothetical protein